ncbi:hypothetical protein WJ59_12160 [Burkholderia gladioli]|uniref:hypothetical protein n=1 Tax=Burkholderia gladioli TaxID=28095 RepID=UPI00075F5A7C|nr:hypothetical protein [Burkholderia gladioli]KVM68747.1 hypothetical protein WJ59_12160 [Burkholderia gladioli]
MSLGKPGKLGPVASDPPSTPSISSPRVSTPPPAHTPARQRPPTRQGGAALMPLADLAAQGRAQRTRSPAPAEVEPSTRERAIGVAAAYGPPALQASAAALSLATGALSRGSETTTTLHAIGATSGAAWAAADLAAELDNWLGTAPHNAAASAANALGVIAGALSAAAALAPGRDGIPTGFASASAWAGGALASAAAVTRLQDSFARILQGGGALANGTAAALSELATQAQAAGDGQRAAVYTIAAGALWLLGATLAGGAAARERQVGAAVQRRAATPDEMA